MSDYKPDPTSVTYDEDIKADIQHIPNQVAQDEALETKYACEFYVSRSTRPFSPDSARSLGVRKGLLAMHAVLCRP